MKKIMIILYKNYIITIPNFINADSIYIYKLSNNKNFFIK